MVQNLSVNSQPYDLCFSPDGRYLFVACIGTKSIYKYDTQNIGLGILWTYLIETDFCVDHISLAIDEDSNVYIGVVCGTYYWQPITYEQAEGHIWGEDNEEENYVFATLGDFLIKIDENGDELWKIQGKSHYDLTSFEFDKADFDLDPILLAPYCVAYFNSKLYVLVGQGFVDWDNIPHNSPPPEGGWIDPNNGKGFFQAHAIAIYDTDGAFEEIRCPNWMIDEETRCEWSIYWLVPVYKTIDTKNNYLIFSAAVYYNFGFSSYGHTGGLFIVVKDNDNIWSYGFEYNGTGYFTASTIFRGITCDENGDLWIVDSLNNKIYKLNFSREDMEADTTYGKYPIVGYGQEGYPIVVEDIPNENPAVPFPLTLTEYSPTLVAPMDCIVLNDNIYIVSAGESKCRIIAVADGTETTDSPQTIGAGARRIAKSGDIL